MQTACVLLQGMRVGLARMAALAEEEAAEEEAAEANAATAGGSTYQYRCITVHAPPSFIATFCAFAEGSGSDGGVVDGISFAVDGIENP